MYQACSCPAVRVYEDPGHPGRYCGAVEGFVDSDLPAREGRLAELGYMIVDADQCGASYRHVREPWRRLELDELPEEPELTYVRVIAEDLTERQAEAVCDELDRLYRTLAGRLYGDADRCAGCPHTTALDRQGPDGPPARPQHELSLA